MNRISTYSKYHCVKLPIASGKQNSFVVFLVLLLIKCVFCVTGAVYSILVIHF